MQWAHLRLKLGRDLGLTRLDEWQPLWVIDFPMFERDDEGILQQCITHSLHQKILPQNN